MTWGIIILLILIGFALSTKEYSSDEEDARKANPFIPKYTPPKK